MELSQGQRRRDIVDSLLHYQMLGTNYRMRRQTGRTIIMKNLNKLKRGGGGVGVNIGEHKSTHPCLFFRQVRRSAKICVKIPNLNHI